MKSWGLDKMQEAKWGTCVIPEVCQRCDDWGAMSGPGRSEPGRAAAVPSLGPSAQSSGRLDRGWRTGTRGAVRTLPRGLLSAVSHIYFL